jgi:hypothetical protein
LRYILLVLVSQAGLLAYCFALGVPLAYLYLWLLPLFSLALYLNGLRVIVEHQPSWWRKSVAEKYKGVDIRPPFTRTIPAGPIERFLFAPMNFLLPP